MFGIADYASFVIAVIVFLMIPGPGNLALITSTSKGGVRGGLAATLGVIAGDQVLMWLAVAGVAALLAAYPPAFRGVQWLGAGYLAWLGLRMLLAKPGDAPVLTIRAGQYFRQALAITLLNPKAIVFYMAFFPLFVDPARPAGITTFAVMAATIAVLTFLYGVIVTLLTHRLAERMRARSAHRPAPRPRRRRLHDRLRREARAVALAAAPKRCSGGERLAPRRDERRDDRVEVERLRQKRGELGRAQLGDAVEGEPAEAVHLGPRPTRATLDEAALAMQRARVEPIREAGEQMQVLLRRVDVPAEVEQRLGGEPQAGLLPGFAQRRLARAFAGVDAALRQSQWRCPVTWQSSSSLASVSTTMPQLRRRWRDVRISSIAHCRVPPRVVDEPGAQPRARLVNSLTPPRRAHGDVASP